MSPLFHRRDFLGTAAGMALAAACAPHAPRAPTTRPVAPEPWGRLEQLADGVWALVSTPLAEGPEARRTLCNGGLIAGRDAVLAVEGLATPAGAAWLGDEAVRLTGRRPDVVVITHFHGDHTGGTIGYFHGQPVEVIATETTRRLIARGEAALPAGRASARPVLLPDRLLPDEGPPVEIDLGGRVARLVARGGHTPSDVVIELDDGIVFAGDLVWNGMFPNYVDAIPSRLSEHVRALRDAGARRWVSGHGEVANAADLARYVDLLDHVEGAARRAIEAGTPLEEAGAAYRVPDGLGAWHMFSPRYPEVAFRAWARELAPERGE